MPNQAIQHHQGDQILYHVNSDPLVSPVHIDIESGWRERQMQSWKALI